MGGVRISKLHARSEYSNYQPVRSGFLCLVHIRLVALAEPLERRDWRGGVGVGVVRLESHSNVVLEVELGLGVILLGLEWNNEIVLDGEDGVDREMRVVIGVNLVDDSGIIRMGDHEMDMSRTHRGAVHKSEKDTGRAVGREGVWSRVVAVPEELSILVCPELATEVVLCLFRVLEIVLTVGRGLPDVTNGANNWLSSLHVFDDSMHVGNSAMRVAILNNAVAKLTEWSVGRPEGAENDVGGG